MKNDKQKTIKAIRAYLGAIKPKEVFYGSILADYVKERVGRKEMFTDTVLRYMRELREEKTINYKVLLKSESKYIKL